MTPEAAKFLKHVRAQCKEHGVKTRIENKPKIRYNPGSDMLVGGYFGIRPPILGCAIGRPEDEWLGILVHESCHMDQWLEGVQVWKDIYPKGKDLDDMFDKWIDGKQYPIAVIVDFLKKIQLVELDCEKRTVNKIIEYNLPIDIKQYIKNANSYIYFYRAILGIQKWCDIPPYAVKEITDLMPDYFLVDEAYFQTNEGLIELYKHGCYI